MITSKPNYLLITTSFPAGGMPGSESAGAFVEDFARALSDIAEVRVIAPALEAGVEERGGVRVNYFKVPRIPLSLMSPILPQDWLAIFRTLRSGDQTVAAEIARETPDHILALWALPSGYWARRHARRVQIPYSIWALGSDIWSLARLPGVREVLAVTLRDAQYCYADGEQLRMDVATHAKRDCEFLASARALPVPERNNFALQPPYKLAFLGRWHVNKGIDILLDALCELNDADWQQIAAVRIAGGGPLQARVETAIQSLKAAGRPVQMHGFLGREAAAELLAWADWLLIPSRIESIPVIFSDALQARCAVLCTPAGDLAELVPKLGVGICTGSMTIDDFVAGLRQAIATPPVNFASALVDAARQFNIAESANRFYRDVQALRAQTK